MCAVLCSGDALSEIEAWASECLDWLRGFLVRENGTPSHDTFGRPFAALDPREFETAFRRWVGQRIPALDGDLVVAIDGKTGRRSTTKANAKPMHLVSALAADIGLVLGQTATTEKSNEIAAIPELLVTLALEGCIVTIDAMGAQTSIASTIRNRGAYYVLCVKDIIPSWSNPFCSRRPAWVANSSQRHKCTTDDGHDRSEVWRCSAFDAVDRLYKAKQWMALKSSRSSSASAPASAANSSARCRPTHSASLMPYAVTGKWRTAFTGASTSSSTRTNPPSAPISPPTISPSFATS